MLKRRHAEIAIELAAWVTALTVLALIGGAIFYFSELLAVGELLPKGRGRLIMDQTEESDVSLL